MSKTREPKVVNLNDIEAISIIFRRIVNPSDLIKVLRAYKLLEEHDHDVGKVVQNALENPESYEAYFLKSNSVKKYKDLYPDDKRFG